MGLKIHHGVRKATWGVKHIKGASVVGGGGLRRIFHFRETPCIPPSPPSIVVLWVSIMYYIIWFILRLQNEPPSLPWHTMHYH